jgi:hypothetical protein
VLGGGSPITVAPFMLTGGSLSGSYALSCAHGKNSAARNSSMRLDRKRSRQGPALAAPCH